MDTIAASSLTRPSVMSSMFTIPGKPPRSATVNAPSRPGCVPAFGMIWTVMAGRRDLVVQHAAAGTRSIVSHRLETHQNDLERALLEAFESEFPKWTKSLASMLSSFEDRSEERRV